jgi:protein-disulfide isomerase
MSSENQSVFKLKPKTAFIAGIIASLFVMGTIGFIVLLGGALDTDAGSVKSAADTTVNTNTAPAAVPTNPAPTPGTVVSIPIDDGDHIRGNVNAPVTIVEYSDYECPFCNKFHPTMKQVMDEYGDQVRWVYKHFPLDSIHSEARPAAIAAECAANLGGNDAFWSFTDSLFENQTRLGDDLYKELAVDLGLSASAFDECYSSKATADKVQEDYVEGQQMGVRGTPGNFVNGQSVSGAVPFESLKQVIDSQL